MTSTVLLLKRNLVVIREPSVHVTSFASYDTAARRRYDTSMIVERSIDGTKPSVAAAPLASMHK